MKYLPQNYERVTSEIMDGAKSAMQNGWLFSEYLEAVKQAWVYAHEDALKQANYQVSKERTGG